MKFTTHAILAAAAIAVAVPAAAQDTVNSTDTVTTAPVERDDNDFPWGLLGLLGLAGLLGRKKNDVHVDRTDHVRR